MLLKKISFFLIVLGSLGAASAVNGKHDAPAEHSPEVKLYAEFALNASGIDIVRIQGKSQQILHVDVYETAEQTIQIKDFRKNNHPPQPHEPISSFLAKDNEAEMKSCQLGDAQKFEIFLPTSQKIKLALNGCDIRVNLKSTSNTAPISVSAATYQIDKDGMTIHKTPSQPYSGDASTDLWETLNGGGPYVLHMFSSQQGTYDTKIGTYVKEFVHYTQKLWDFFYTSADPKIGIPERERPPEDECSVAQAAYREAFAFLKEEIEKISRTYAKQLKHDFPLEKNPMAKFNVATLPPMPYFHVKSPFASRMNSEFFPIEHIYEKMLKRIFIYNSCNNEKAKKDLSNLMTMKKNMEKDLADSMQKYAGRIAKMTWFDAEEREELRRKSAFFDPQNKAGI